MNNTNRLLITALCCICAFLSARIEARPIIKETAEFEALREEISLLNLLRGLYLSRDQVLRLEKLAHESRKLQENARKAFANDSSAIISAYSNLRDALFKPQGSETDAQNRAVQIENRIKEARENLFEQLYALEDQAIAVLSSSQKSIVDSFVPCLVPPQDLSNPVRVGQAGAELGLVGKLSDLMYGAPDELWKSRGSALLDKIVVHIQSHTGEMHSSLKGDMRKRLEQAAENIRSASELDYPLKKAQLASDLHLIDRSRGMVGGRMSIGKVGRWFLSDTAAAILPRWRKAIESGLEISLDVAAVETSSVQMGFEKVGAMVVQQLTQYAKRHESRSTRLYENLVLPVERAVAAKNPDAFFAATVSALEQVGAQAVNPQLNNQLLCFITFMARDKDLQVLLHPQIDPFGFMQELEAAKESANTTKAFEILLALARYISQFKRV